MITWPQFVMFTGIGEMKSFSEDVNDWPDERLFSIAAPRWKHLSAGNTCASVRLIAASPNVEDTDPLLATLPARVLGALGGLKSITFVLFTAAFAKAPRGARSPQHGTVFDA